MSGTGLDSSLVRLRQRSGTDAQGGEVWLSTVELKVVGPFGYNHLYFLVAFPNKIMLKLLFSTRFILSLFVFFTVSRHKFWWFSIIYRILIWKNVFVTVETIKFCKGIDTISKLSNNNLLGNLRKIFCSLSCHTGFHFIIKITKSDFILWHKENTIIINHYY